MKKIRVAAAQFAVGTDVQANLESCLHWIARAGHCKPDLVVLPEFVNHCSWYDDQAHCDRVSVDLDGPFIKALAAAAAGIKAFVVANVTLRRPEGHCTGTSLLFSPTGEVLATNDKQVLIGHENDFLKRAATPGPITDTAIGRLGLYACMDGVVAETPRCLALRGAQVLCNSLNSFASDEGSLHIPVRAAESRVFVVAANKVGPLIPEAILEPVSAATGIPVKFLNGAGESQIVAPDGTVLAIASTTEPQLIWADIDVSEADARQRPDGTNVFTSRRPDLYAPIAQDPAQQPAPSFSGAADVRVAAVQLPGTGQGSVAAALDAVRDAVAQGARYIVLPELFHAPALTPAALAEATLESAALVSQLAAVCGKAAVALNLIEAVTGGHQLSAVLVDASGIVLRQPLLHRTARHGWSKTVAQLATLQRADAHVAVLCGDDSIYPETSRLLAMRGVDLLLVPLAPQEAWELRTGLVERAAENRMNLVAACQPGALGTSLIAALQKDFTVLTPWESRPFDGLLSQPMLTHAPHWQGITLATVHPANAANKVVSRGTDMVRGRCWWLSGPIAEPLKN